MRWRLIIVKTKQKLLNVRHYFISILYILILPFALDAGNLESDVRASDVISPDACESVNQDSRFHFALRSNGLLDIALIPNVTFEFGRGRYSGSATWAAAWWGGRNKCWRMYGGEAEWRCYFGKASGCQAFAGHHAGVFVGLFTYDIKLGEVGRQCPDVAASWGVSYGYSFPIARQLNLDLNIGLGFIHSHYTRYRYMCDQHICDGNRKLHYFGPVKAEVSIVWILGK